MMSYSLKRRSFLGLLGGAFGLRALLQNIEAHAQGMPPARRLLVMHHPVGTYRAAWLCQRSGADFTLSRLLEPFAALKSETIVLDGMDLRQDGPGGGHEAGTVWMMTGTPTRYTRAGQPETDDAAADGPSVDQLLLAKSAELRSPAIDSLQVSCDDRIDAEELSTRRLSYSTNRVPVSAAGGANGQQNEPISPELSPLALYTRVFGEMMPGGVTEDQAARILKSKKSILDFSLREVERLRTLAPASASAMIDAHAQAIRAAEEELVIDTPEGCVVPTPPAAIAGHEDDGEFKGPTDYSNPSRSTADHELHAQIGKAHFAVIKAALACDLTRVVTFQWSPGTNHVSFGGMYPSDPSAILMHHPVSHRIGAGDLAGTNPVPTRADPRISVSRGDLVQPARRRAPHRAADHHRRLRRQPARPDGRALRDRGGQRHPPARSDTDRGVRGQGARFQGQPIPRRQPPAQRHVAHGRRRAGRAHGAAARRGHPDRQPFGRDKRDLGSAGVSSQGAIVPSQRKGCPELHGTVTSAWLRPA